MKIEPEKFTELMGRNNGNGEWLTAKEALENGLVDTILQVSDTAALDTSSLQMFHYPEIPKDKALAPVPLTVPAAEQTLVPTNEPENKENNASNSNAIIAAANAALTLSNC
ncbi:hypothetical protein EZS27_015915 [termite gut metagenome]|uniref:Uncharacterized protein n=1 Tax=termite gut metagenome TaxID=433724 RepID=A0A5J4RQC6_9ZZZZ